MLKQEQKKVMKKFKNPQDVGHEDIKPLFIICSTVLGGYWLNNPLPQVHIIKNKVRVDWLKKMFKKISASESLYEKFCNACDKSNIPIPFE